MGHQKKLMYRFHRKDIIEGKVYTKINQTVLNSGGTYDGMCGIISNFEWTS